MLKHCVRTLVVTLLIPIAAALSYAQSNDTPKVEVGVQFSGVRLRDLSDTDGGYGIRFGYNITDSLAAEAEFNYFPGDLTDLARFYPGLPANTVYSQNRTQGLVGVKYMALRGDKFGIGGKFRPGFFRFNGDGGAGGAIGCGPGATALICQLAAGKTNFAMDLGGVFEYYPARKLFTRFDLGATIIRFGGPSDFAADGFNSTNLQFSAGVGVRF
jgi:Outer membrane protein beta-barrel domain